MSEKKEITLIIDEASVTVPEGTTILHAAEMLGIDIPRLCYHPDLSLAGSCRVCIVEVEGYPHFMTACSTAVAEGMVVKTGSPGIRRARRDIVELLLNNHPKACLTCERDGNCELQNLAYATGVRDRLFEGERKRFAIDASSRSVVRNPEKCILCGRCIRVCSEIQGVSNLGQQRRGFHTVVSPAHEENMDDSVCIQCGQCIAVCPTAAFLEQASTEAVWQALDDPDIHVVVQTAPAIRAAIGEGFNSPPGTPMTRKMVTALRRMGFDTVFDTNFGADLTIWEESFELLKRINGDGPLPLITSCSPGWISFLERFYPSLIPLASSCKSPMSMLSTLSKTYYAEKSGIPPEKIFNVAIMPCVAKKFEAQRPEHLMEDGTPYTDAVLTTRELIWMIKCYGIDLGDLEESEFDMPLGLSTGGGDIFGTTGGVMEAALRAAHEMLTGKPMMNVDIPDVRAVEGLRVKTMRIGEHDIRLGVANGLRNARTLLDQVRDGDEEFHVLEVMACPGGCIGGGGQPYPPKGMPVLSPTLLALRAQALYDIDRGKSLRRPLDNPGVKELYESYLGEPGSERSHELLHTNYHARLPRGI